MSAFAPFSKLIHERLTQLSAHELFVVGEDSHALYDVYLSSFPEGTNPIYKTNTEHDCSCCKNFIRNLGNVVAIIDGRMQSIWNVKGAGYPYDEVADALDSYVLSQPIVGLFRSSERQYGAEQTKQLLENNQVMKWNHFHGKVASRHYSRTPDRAKGDHATAAQVLKRGLDELSMGAIAQVIDLINEKAIYRGEEHIGAVKSFKLLQTAYKRLETAQERNTFVWSMAGSPAARFRNTVIGTLIQDLSAGVDLDAAVRSFEQKVAPTNYKRPTALITPSMIKDAMKTLNELGLEPALERRFAKISDVSVNNVLWVDNSVKSQMKNGIEDLLLQAAVNKAPKDAKAEDISIEDFMAGVLPSAVTMDLLVKNTQLNNFMSLTAPVQPDSGKLFKWDNDFGWSYDGNITDSIKEKVKRAGGNTNAPLRVSLAWFNHDDLDIHVKEPGGNVISFHNKSGKLDVDMNAGGGHTREPVENVSWVRPADGVYTVMVDQYQRRETSNPGFVIEIENNGHVQQFSHALPANGRHAVVATFNVTKGQITTMQLSKNMVGGSASQDKWGVKTETYVKVNTLMHSPNHWDDNAVGNKHHFFILDGCKNDEPTRGIYNEFLHPGLEKHRKVFEILGDKTKCQPSEEQLSGLGFSSTRGDQVIVRVAGTKLQKTFNIKF